MCTPPSSSIAAPVERASHRPPRDSKPLRPRIRFEIMLRIVRYSVGGMFMSRTVFVLNGPNLNLLGKRQPQIYGYETLADVERDCMRTAAELKLEVRFHQSNREYEMIDWIHEARETAGGIVTNPAAFTHTSVAILDALNACEFPIFEVHISNVHKREAFRHHSYVSLRADGVMAGLG